MSFFALFRGSFVVACLTLLAFSVEPTEAAEDVFGHDKLKAELGSELPTGVGVWVMISEANTDGNKDPETGLPLDGKFNYVPDPGWAQFAATTFYVAVPASTPTGADFSAHAGGVGTQFIGSNSMAPGATNVHASLADDWIVDAGLRTYIPGSGTALAPRITMPDNPLTALDESTLPPARVVNHSWIGIADRDNVEILQRMDWIADQDNQLNVNGASNGGANTHLLAGAFNGITVGRMDGGHGTSTPASGGPLYVANRTRPHVVGYGGATSGTTPQVASLATMLVGHAHDNAGLSNGSELTRDGRTIYHGETVEATRAIMMASASKDFHEKYPTESLRAWEPLSANNLDTTYGAGMINAYDAYHMLNAGEQDSFQDGGSATVEAQGWDYDAQFGGLSGSNDRADYFLGFTTDSQLSATLSWNSDVDMTALLAIVEATAESETPDLSATAELYDLTLSLYDVTDDPGSPVLVQRSASGAQSGTVADSTENLWYELVGGRDYRISVEVATGQSPFLWDYALAWQVETTAVPTPSAVVMGCLALAALGARRRLAGIIFCNSLRGASSTCPG